MSTLFTQPPNLTDYTTFLQNVVGVPTADLPSTVNPINALNISLNIALGIVSQQLLCIDPDVYALAVYNLAADRLINFAQDQPGQTYFATQRANYNIGGLGFVAGVVASTADQSTSTSLAVPDSLKQLTVLDLQNMQTPWGRNYIGFAMMLGPTIWGLS